MTRQNSCESNMNRVENVVRKGKIAGNKHFLLFPTCFVKAFSSGSFKVGLVC